MRLLLIGDDRRLSSLLAGGLRRAGFTVDPRDSSADIFASAAGFPYEVVLLDFESPQDDEAAAIARLRARAPSVPVLVITGRPDLAARVGATGGAADDYVVKPFDMAELVARIQLLRRPADDFQPT